MWHPGKQSYRRPIGHQVWAMRELFPQFIYERNQGWTGTLKPSPGSPDYRIRINYRIHTSPRVFVLSPKLLPGTPHIYRTDGALCLYYPDDRSWSSEMLIAKTIVPWTTEWLHYYEIWQVTDKWFGPEAPHVKNK